MASDISFVGRVPVKTDPSKSRVRLRSVFVPTLRRLVLILVLTLSVVPAPVLAQWRPDGVPVCVSVNGQGGESIVSDGMGGAIVTWQDYRDGNWDIYAQRILAGGTVQWTANGVPLCTDTSNQYSPTIASDGAGGAIVTWQDYRNGNWDIYAQRILAGGTVHWAANGVPLCAATGTQVLPTIVSAGAGGAIVTWQDYRSGTDYDVYAQRILADGTIPTIPTTWTPNGVALCTATGDQEFPTIVSAGAGGAIVTWQDYRSGTNYDVYARLISADGTTPLTWTANGVPLCTATGDQESPTIVSDGAGGAIVTWQDYRSGANYDVYAQLILADGTIPTTWTSNGVALRIVDPTLPE